MKTKLTSLLLALILGASAVLVSCDGENPPETVGETAAADTVTESIASSETAPAEGDGTEPSAEGVKFTLRDGTGKPGETVELELSMAVSVMMNSVALYELSYDKDLLTFKGFVDWQEFEDTRCVIPGGVDEEKQIIILAMKDIASLDETVCRIAFEINPDAAEGTTAVEMKSLVKYYSDPIASSVDGAEITIEK